MQSLEHISILSGNEHVKGFAKCQIANDVEAVIIEPPRHFNGLANIVRKHR
jgi:hypothetical protein